MLLKANHFGTLASIMDTLAGDFPYREKPQLVTTKHLQPLTALATNAYPIGR